MIVLRSSDLLVCLDPDHGGEILDLIDCVNGRQLLGRPPFTATDRVGGELDEATWTGAYRGGWQLLAPNAGNACCVDGVLHGFHGRASADPWSVIDSSESTATLRWVGHGLDITRQLTIFDGSLEATTRFEAVAERAPFVSVEHCSVGLDILHPGVEIRLPAGAAYELSERNGPVTAPADAPTWPEIGLLEGGTERGDAWPLSVTRARFLAVSNAPVGSAQILNTETGVGLELEWDVEVLPHLWVWHEIRVSDGPWRRHAEILAVEPASVPHSLGLDVAIENDQAHWVERGSPVVQRIKARPIRPPRGG